MSDADSDTDEVQWQLGFLEPAEPLSLLRHRFPNKVGGRPAWLNPLKLPSVEELTCAATGRPLNFLLQVYATPPALDHREDAFHRMLYIFISPEGNQLSKAGAVKAFRCQLPRVNKFYSDKPAGEADIYPPPVEASSAGAKSSQDPWNVAQHEQAPATCQTPAVVDGLLIFPEQEIIIEAEEDVDDDNADEQAQRLIRQYEADRAVNGELPAEEVSADVLSAVEQNIPAATRHFVEFAATVARVPEQVLRYCFEPAAVPLWPAPAPVPAPEDVPECQYCGSPRHFEFQVMPQLLNDLEQDASDSSSPDWGAIAVYTCGANCSLKDAAYAQEYVFVQPSG